MIGARGRKVRGVGVLIPFDSVCLQVSLGRSKEVHFFDKPAHLGLLPYLVNFG